MRLYCTEIGGAEGRRARLPGRSPGPGSAFGVSLLAYAAGDYWGAKDLPAVETAETGRPYFPLWPGRCFSISHSRSHVLVAVSDFPVGADIETRRERPLKLIEKLTTPREREDFDFFELWVLRESLFKLTGRGDLRSMRFARENGVIVPPAAGACCRLYGDIPGCAAAVSCFCGDFPESVTMVDISEICT